MSKQVKVGSARYGGSKRKYWKLKDGESTFRILPPIGDLADEGRWSVFYNIHYGYQNSKKQVRAFQSPLVKNRKSGMIEVPDAALERLQSLKSKLEEAKKSGDKAAVSKLMELAGGPKSRFNLDSNHYVNAMDEQGNIGILKFRHRAMLSLQVAIKNLRDKGIDPLSVENGRFFVFNRSGNALDTTYQVSVKQNKRDIEGVGEVYQDVVHKLTPEILSRLGEEAAQLDKLFKRPTAEQVARIVKEGSTAVDEIFDEKVEEVAAAEDPSFEDEYGLEQPPVAAVSTATVETVTVQPNVTAKSTNTGDLAASVIASKPQALSTPPKTTAQVISDMSVDEFLATLDA